MVWMRNAVVDSCLENATLPERHLMAVGVVVEEGRRKVLHSYLLVDHHYFDDKICRLHISHVQYRESNMEVQVFICFLHFRLYYT